MNHDFVASALTDSRAATVLSAVIDLAHRLGLLVIAEGVESAETASRMEEFDCDILQGYYFSAPVAADELLKLLKALDVSPEAADERESALS